MEIERLKVDDNPEIDFLVNEHQLRYEVVGSLVKEKIILDIACGSGYGTNYLAEMGAKYVIGADIDEYTILNNKIKYKHDNLEFLKANALDLPFEDNKFEIIISLETIEHFTAEQQSLVLSEFKRVLKSDGLLIISTPNSIASKNKNPWHLKELNKKELSDLLESNFKYYKIYEQGAALASFIKGDDSGQFTISTDFKSKFFLSLASDIQLTSINSAASLNPLALSVKDNNPLMKILDKIYYPLSKLWVFKKIFAYFASKALKN